MNGGTFICFTCKIQLPTNLGIKVNNGDVRNDQIQMLCTRCYMLPPGPNLLTQTDSGVPYHANIPLNIFRKDRKESTLSKLSKIGSVNPEPQPLPKQDTNRIEIAYPATGNDTFRPKQTQVYAGPPLHQDNDRTIKGCSTEEYETARNREIIPTCPDCGQRFFTQSGMALFFGQKYFYCIFIPSRQFWVVPSY